MFVSQLVTRYSKNGISVSCNSSPNSTKGFVHKWEIRNEPNILIDQSLNKGKTRKRLADLYTESLFQAYTVIKGINSSDYVILGGMGDYGEANSLSNNEMDFVKRIISTGKKKYKTPYPFDAINFHIYGGNADINNFTSVKDYLSSSKMQLTNFLGNANLFTKRGYSVKKAE